jgi:hypothetical protein
MPMVHLMNAQDIGELGLMKSLLESNGIAYVVHHEHVSSLYPGLPSFTCRVLVDESERANAEILLSRLRLQLREASNSI